MKNAARNTKKSIELKSIYVLFIDIDRAVDLFSLPMVPMNKHPFEVN